MRDELRYKIPEKGLTIWRIYGFFQTLLVVLVAIIATIITYQLNGPTYIYIVASTVVVVFAFLFIWLFPNIKHKVWRYEVREQEVEIQSGLFIVKRTLIPMVRVQHVDTEQGPILKKYGLSNISVSSAATIHKIPFLLTGEAAQLRSKISELARVAEEDV